VHAAPSAACGGAFGTGSWLPNASVTCSLVLPGHTICHSLRTLKPGAVHKQKLYARCPISLIHSQHQMSITSQIQSIGNVYLEPREETRRPGSMGDPEISQPGFCAHICGNFIHPASCARELQWNYLRLERAPHSRPPTHQPSHYIRKDNILANT
jgi:hypothetical protein